MDLGAEIMDLDTQILDLGAQILETEVLFLFSRFCFQSSPNELKGPPHSGYEVFAHLGREGPKNRGFDIRFLGLGTICRKGGPAEGVGGGNLPPKALRPEKKQHSDQGSTDFTIL